MTIGNARIL